MRYAPALRTALMLAVALAASTQLGAQTTPRLPAGAQPAVEPTVNPRPISKISPTGGVSLPGVRPLFGQSLLVSLDGLHWGKTVTISYTNTCSHGPPSSCGVTPPHTTVHVSWNPSIPPSQMALEGANSYYLIDVTPFGDTCWDVTKISYVIGNQGTSSFTFGGPAPNATQSYSCTYQISARVNQNGSVQTVTTNPVTVNVNIVQGTP